MLLKKTNILCLLLTAVLTASCYYSHPNRMDHWIANEEHTVDSVNFYIGHHYWRNYNFFVTDSVQLYSSLPGSIDGVPSLCDTFFIFPEDRLVVADIRSVPGDTVDSVWVKVARDQLTQGWTRESLLLESVVPDDPISKFIKEFSSSRLIFVLTCLALAGLIILIRAVRRQQIRVVHFNDVNSFYPTLLCLGVSATAAIYGSIQRFVPNTWVEFYFHPTLNPFNPSLPLVISLFLAFVWFVIVVSIAVTEDLFHQDETSETVPYLFSLAGVCLLLYLVFTLTVHYYIGYPLLAYYWYFAVKRYRKHPAIKFRCGNCGRPLLSPGKCPYCNMENQL